MNDEALTEYMKELGAKGGKATSAKKRKAARANLLKARSLRWAYRKLAAKRKKAQGE